MLTRRQIVKAGLACTVFGSQLPAALAANPFPIKAYLSDLDEILRIDSKTGYAEGVNRVGQVFRKRFESIGWTVTEYPCGKNGNGIVASNRKDQSAFDIILCGHLDTVQPVGNAKRYPLTIQGNFAHGAGVADDKGSLTALWWIARDLPKALTEKLRICVMLAPGEEVGDDEHNRMIADIGRRAKYALVYEPGRPNGAFVKVRKGCTWMALDFKGVAAHAGNNPQDGRNAIDAMARAIGKVTALARDYKGLTINTGTVKGGTAPNTVAADARVVFDMRFLRNEDRYSVLSKVRALCDKGFADGVRTTLSLPSDLSAMPEIESSRRLMGVIEKAASELGQPKPEWLIVGGASDGNALAQAGVGVVDAMGVCGGNLHNPEKEFLDLRTVEPRIALGKRVLEVFAASL